MSRNGSGTYSLPEAPFVYDTVISETAVNSNFSDIAAALTQSLSKDGQTPPSANLPMGGYRHTGVGNGAARNDYAAVGQVQDESVVWCGTAGGTANALTLTPSPAITAYATGQRFRFKAGASPSDDAVTIAVSGLTAKAAEIDDTALSSTRVISAGKYYEVLYDGTAFQVTRLSGVGVADIANGTDGELITWNADGEPATVAVGTAGQVLTSNGAGAAPTFQSISNTTDQTARDMAATAMAVADANGAAGSTGVFYLIDPFATDTLATSTNATYDSSGDYYTSATQAQISGATGTNIGNMTAGGGLAAAFDGTTNQSSAASAGVSGTGTVGKDWGIGVTKTILKAIIYGPNDNAMRAASGAGTDVVKLIGSNVGLGSSEVELWSGDSDGSNSEVITVNQADLITTTAYRYHYAKVTQPGANASYIAELQLFEAGTAADVILAPTAGTLDTADPSDLMGYFVFDPIDTVTFGTDVIGKLSIDGNSTKATGAWTKVGDYGTSGQEIWRLDADVSAQTGSAVDYEITTANNKTIQYHRCIGIVPLY